MNLIEKIFGPRTPAAPLFTDVDGLLSLLRENGGTYPVDLMHGTDQEIAEKAVKEGMVTWHTGSWDAPDYYRLVSP